MRLSNLLLTIIIASFTNLYSRYDDVVLSGSPVLYNKPVSATNSTDLSVNVFNYGDTLRSLTLILIIDGNEVDTTEWEGEILPYEAIDLPAGSFTFQAKTDLTPYEVQVRSELPNGNQDMNTYDDYSDYTYIGPALPGGTYIIGSEANDHFEDPTIASAVISTGGISGNVELLVRAGDYFGPVAFVGNDGTYGLSLKAHPDNATNDSVYIYNYAGYYTGAKKDGPSTQEYYQQSEVPYSLYLNNFNNFEANGITFGAEYDYFSYDVYTSRFEYSNEVLIQNCTFIAPLEGYGIDETKKGNNKLQNAIVSTVSRSIYLQNSNYVEITNNTFWNGVKEIEEQSYMMCDRNIRITDNEFNYPVCTAVFLVNDYAQNCSTYVSNVDINNNTVKGDPNILYDEPLIYSRNGTTLSGNSLSGFKGDGTDPAPSVVLIEHDGDLPEDESLIENNNIGGTGPGETIEDMSGITVTGVNNGKILNNSMNIQTSVGNEEMSKSGISIGGVGTNDTYFWAQRNNITMDNGDGINLNNANTKTYYNDITVNGSAAYPKTGIKAENSAGFIGVNRIRGNEFEGTRATNSGSNVNPTGGLYYCYNSIGITSNTYSSVTVEGGANTGTIFRRNMVVNFGDGTAIRGLGGPVWTSNQNNWYSEGDDLGFWNGQIQTTYADYFAASGQDANSANVEVEFDDENSLRPLEFDPNLAYDEPLFDPNGPLAEINQECEAQDFFGNERETFFIGFNNPITLLDVTVNVDDVIDCEGATGRFFFFQVVATDENGNPSTYPVTYQWYRDGEALEGQTFQGLNLGPLQYDMIGTFRCSAASPFADTLWSSEAVLHVLQTPSITQAPETKIAAEGDDVTFMVEANIYGELPPDYRTDVQWYKGSTPITDNERISGSKSSIMKILDVQADDFANDYWVRLIGHCGILQSATFSLNEAPKVTFDSQPADISECSGENFEFTIDASVENGTIESYDWYVNGTSTGVNSATYSGTTQSNLTVQCKVTTAPGGYAYMSDEASLTVLEAPVITTDLEDSYEVDEGEDITLSIEASGDDIDYEWFRDDDTTPLATGNSLTIVGATEADSGSYYCVATNTCDVVTSNTTLLEVKTSRISLSVEDKDNIYKLHNVPNPFESSTTIHFELPNAEEVRITITDMASNLVLENNLGLLGEGPNSIEINSSDLANNQGVYILTLNAGEVSISRKLVLIK